jgi:hypothetical protein
MKNGERVNYFSQLKSIEQVTKVWVEYHVKQEKRVGKTLETSDWEGRSRTRGQKSPEVDGASNGLYHRIVHFPSWRRIWPGSPKEHCY